MNPIEAATAAVRRGDLLAAYDHCASAIARGDSAERLRYLQVLALARMGDTGRALGFYEDYRLGESGDIDCLALRGRLLKDAALAGSAAARKSLFGAASEAYREVFDRSGDTFPGINAASLALIAGDTGTARTLAASVVARLPDPPDTYFAAATLAEARLVLGDPAGAAAAMRAAAGLDVDDEGARSSTFRQLALLVDTLALPAQDREAVLAPARPGGVMMFAGHMFRDRGEGQAPLAWLVEAALERHRIRIGYGALACGADIVIAEALLRRGGELNVVLPFAREDFERQSVFPGGDTWHARFIACLDAARSVDFASEAGFVGDDNQFAYGSAVAMGLAQLRARHLGVEPVQVAVWDGLESAQNAGTARDVAAWRALGGRVEIIAPSGIDRRMEKPASLPARDRRREMRAIIFCDFAGFSRLHETELPVFWDEVMGRAARVLDRYGGSIRAANTWGDALFVCAADIAAAANIVLDLQADLTAATLDQPGPGAGARMRFGLHYGPVYVTWDPVTGRENLFGTEVNRAARVEPIAPVGEIFATHQFAAMLAMAGSREFVLGYAGTVSLAKESGEAKMFRLSRA